MWSFEAGSTSIVLATYVRSYGALEEGAGREIRRLEPTKPRN